MAEERRFIIVTGADSGYYPLMRELIASIRVFPQGRTCSIGVIDAGLTQEQRDALTRDGCLLATPGWEFDFPAFRTRGRDFLKANIAKLFLPKHFPGFDVIVWIDSDAWVQDWEAVDLYIRAAERGRFAVVAQAGRYRGDELTVRWLLGGLVHLRSILFKNGRRAGLPQGILRRIALKPTLNAGAYALRADAPHWAAFQRWQERVIRRGRIFTSDQLAMALAIYVDGLPLELLPEWCNYIGPWRFDATGPMPWVEYYLPHRPLGIVHMAGADDMRMDLKARRRIPDLDDQFRELNVRYPLWAGRLPRPSEDLLAATEGEAQTGQGGPGLEAVVD